MYITEVIAFTLGFFVNQFVSLDVLTGIDVEKRVSNRSIIKRRSSEGVQEFGGWATTGLIECEDGIAHCMAHIKIPFVFSDFGPNHEALEFDVVCGNGFKTKYTIDFERHVKVLRRFGWYSRRSVKKSTSICLSIQEIDNISYTNHEYELFKYNCQTYAHEMYPKLHLESNSKMNYSRTKRRSEQQVSSKKVIWKIKQTLPADRCCEKCIMSPVKSNAMQQSKFLIIFCFRFIICLSFVKMIYLEQQNIN